MASSGGPLLTVDDLLHDLSKEPSPPKFPWWNRSPEAGQEDQADDHILSSRDLPKELEKTCRDLKLSLERPGYAWIGLSHELCTALAAADEINRTSGEKFEELGRHLRALLAIVNRGREALEKVKGRT